MLFLRLLFFLRECLNFVEAFSAFFFREPILVLLSSSEFSKSDFLSLLSSFPEKPSKPATDNNQAWLKKKEVIIKSKSTHKALRSDQEVPTWPPSTTKPMTSNRRLKILKSTQKHQKKPTVYRRKKPPKFKNLLEDSASEGGAVVEQRTALMEVTDVDPPVTISTKNNRENRRRKRKGYLTV
nr:hypothetical protein Iba_chr06bCG2850 [Ipomoea batatas]